MADVRCPMCGKTNPEEAEKCLFCGEPLNSGDIFNPQENSGSESPDWLSGLRSSDWQGDSGGSTDAEEPPAAEEGEIPDWLSRVRSRSQEEESQSDLLGEMGSETSPAEDEPDWLKSLAGDNPQSEGSADDWLANLGGGEPKEPAETEAEQPQPAPESEWLSNLRATGAEIEPEQSDELAEEQSEQQPAQAEEATSDNEWMASLADWTAPAEDETNLPTPEAPGGFTETGDFTQLNAESAEEKPGSEEAVPDWFAQLTGAPSESAPVEDSQPDWMPKESSDQPPPQAEPEPEAGALPDWLAGITAAGMVNQAAEEKEELPDWISRATPQAAEDETTPAAEELPEWLQHSELPAEEPAAAPVPEELPGWLSQETEAALPADAETTSNLEGFAAESVESPSFESEETSRSLFETPGTALFGEAESAEPVGEDQSAASAENIPDFSGLFAEQAEETEAEQTPLSEEGLDKFGAAAVVGAGLAAGLPDWMATGDEPADQPPADEAVGEEAAALPAWMKDFDEAGEAPAEPLETSTPFVEEGLPAWLDGMKTGEGTGADESVSPLIEPAEQEIFSELNAPFQVELPEWMDETEPAESGETQAEAAGAEMAESLEKADLPSWVEDLRPLESVIPGEVRSDTGETLVEKAGPLAGMRGILQSEDLTSHYRKPPVYSARLNVSERQRTQAAILGSLLAAETASKEVPAEASRAPQFILRVVIALVLILALLTMLLPDFSLVKLSSVYPPGLLELYERVENLPADSAVLLAFDYEPGLSGEMRFAANSTIEHLMVKNARLAIVSTVPTGPVLAENLLAEVNNRRPEYNLTEQTVNLGYLPGGTTSLLEFAQNPQRATPYATDTPLTGVAAWDYPALAGVEGLQDFAQVIVLTDSPETGRAWIEQVQPVLGSVPLTMITSAQAGPMLQPYYDSAQIQGMVVGLQGGAMYEQESGRVNLANRFWGSYQTGILAGLLLLVLGGIISGVMGGSMRKPAQKGKA